MSLFRMTGRRNGLCDDLLQPGDLTADGRSIGSLTTVGAGTILGSMFAQGILARTGPVGGYTDTTDSAANILAALTGNAPDIDVVPGLAFTFLYQNQVAQAMTLAAGAGVVLGSNVNVAASLVREYLVTVLNASPPVTLNCNTTNASAAVVLATPIQMGTFDYTQNRAYGTITPGMSVSGTGISAGATIIGLTYGQGTITGFTLSSNATATNNGVALACTPTVRIDGLRSATA